MSESTQTTSAGISIVEDGVTWYIELEIKYTPTWNATGYAKFRGKVTNSQNSNVVYSQWYVLKGTSAVGGFASNGGNWYGYETLDTSNVHVSDTADALGSPDEYTIQGNVNMRLMATQTVSPDGKVVTWALAGNLYVDEPSPQNDRYSGNVTASMGIWRNK